MKVEFIVLYIITFIFMMYYYNVHKISNRCLNKGILWMHEGESTRSLKKVRHSWCEAGRRTRDWTLCLCSQTASFCQWLSDRWTHKSLATNLSDKWLMDHVFCNSSCRLPDCDKVNKTCDKKQWLKSEMWPTCADMHGHSHREELFPGMSAQWAFRLNMYSMNMERTYIQS